MAVWAFVALLSLVPKTAWGCEYDRNNIQDRVAASERCYRECGGDVDTGAAQGRCFEVCADRLLCEGSHAAARVPTPARAGVTR
jgi:hypothetical protein